MAFTLEDALNKIGTVGYTGVEGLTRLINETSAVAENAATNATILLYSGDVGENTHAWDVANATSASSLDSSGLKRVVTLNDTAISALLNHDDFKGALREAAGSADKFRLIMNGEDPLGTRVNNTSFWDTASRNFAGSATSDILTITPNVKANSVFALTEVDAALNSNALRINGIPREDLVRLRTDLLARGPGTQADIDIANKIVLDYVNSASAQQVSEMKIAVDADGNVFDIDSKAYFNKVGMSGVGTHLDVGITGKSPVDWIAQKQTTEALSNAKLANVHLEQIGQERLSLAQATGDSTKIAAAGRYLNKLGVIGDVIVLALVAGEANAAYASGDSDKAQQLITDWALEFSGGVAGGIAAAQLASSLLAPLYLTGPAGALIAGGLSLIAGIAGGIGGGYLAQQLADYFTSAQTWTAPVYRDPLTLDLDGDGIETTAQTGWNGVLFDHNNNGQKTGTGWLSGDDGFLVLDKNNNGTIDNGNELFGDNTQLTNGADASDGFAALADVDSNQDGQIDSNDAIFNDLRVWQDLNQDGISQANELKTLTELNIASLSTTGTATGTAQNGNIITHTGSFTKTDGSTGQTGNLDLAASTFHTQYTETTPLSATAAARPDMHGSGSVHNLRNAAALSATLASTLDQYSAASTREQQQSQLDSLLSQWSDTSTMQGLMARAAANGFIINFTFGNQQEPTNNSELLASGTTNGSLGVLEGFNQNKSVQYQNWVNKLTLLERFNGTAFINFDSLDTSAATELNGTTSGTGGSSSGALSSSYKQLNLTIAQAQLDLLQQSYQTLKQSVYESLLPQTRFKPYLDEIGLNFADGAFQLDYSVMEAHFKTDISNNNTAGVKELFEFVQVMAGKLDNWDYKAAFTVDYFSGLNVSEAQSSTEFGIKLLGASLIDYQAASSDLNIIANQIDNKQKIPENEAYWQNKLKAA